MKRVLILICLCLFLSASWQANAQLEAKPDPLEELNDQWGSDAEVVVPNPNSRFAGADGGDGTLRYVVDEETKRMFGKALYENQLWAMERNASIYAWQDFSTRFIFWTVLILVFFGVLLSGIQFFKGKTAPNGESSAEMSHVEISMQGLKVSSPFLGVVLLVVSLGFFYLYLVYVYPIGLSE